VGDRRQAEIRDIDPDAHYFTPPTGAPDAGLRRYRERPPELQPAIDGSEAFLLAVFLRRYVTYCARRGRFAAMNGAARLYAEIGRAAARFLIYLINSISPGRHVLSNQGCSGP
jgi:hypothetical protein